LGKKADVIVIDTKKPHFRPRHDPLTALVYAADASDVRHVFVDGEWLVRHGELARMDVEAVMRDAEREVDLVLERVGVERGL
jgi:5-methylthioadenosine/S-adenosylhomocysteine deaminase